MNRTRTKVSVKLGLASLLVLVSVCLLGASTAAEPSELMGADPFFQDLTKGTSSENWSQNFGTIERIVPTPSSQIVFRLTGGMTAMNPTNGWYALEKTHPHYDATVDLLVKAAENQWVVFVQSEPALNHLGRAIVVFIAIDF